MANTTHITTVAVMIVVFSCVVIFHVQIVDLKNRLAAAHAHIDALAEHVTELRHHQNEQPQPQPQPQSQPDLHVPASDRRLSEIGDFDLESYVRKLKLLKQPAGVNLNNNNSFVLFGQPVDYVLSRKDDHLMVAGKQFFVQGQFKVSGPMMLPYYTPAVLHKTQKACDAEDPQVDSIACSLLSYSKIIEVQKTLDNVTAELRKFKIEQGNNNKLTKDDCNSYTDLRSGQVKQYADRSAREKADRAEAAAKLYTDQTKQNLTHYTRQEAANKAGAVQNYTEHAITDVLSKANGYTDKRTDAVQIFLQSLNETAGVAQLRAAQQAIQASLLDAKGYTDTQIKDAKQYADETAKKQAVLAREESQNYSDAMQSTLQEFARQEAKTKADAAQKAATDAISKAKEALTNSTQKYSNDIAMKKADAAEQRAKQYTDEAKVLLETFATNKADAAQKHADTVGVQTLSKAKSDAQQLAEAAAARKATEAQTAAQNYTDAVDRKVMAVKEDLTRTESSLVDKVNQVDTRSKAYTDEIALSTKSYALNTAFPVDSLYITYDEGDPTKVFPGTEWERVAGGRTLVGVVPATDNTNYGSYSFKQAGSSFPKVWRSAISTTLSADQIPEHRHDSVWRWLCDPTKAGTNSREKCARHNQAQLASYIDSGSEDRLSGITGVSDMLDAWTWRSVNSVYWRDKQDVDSSFNSATAGKGKSFDIDIMQPFVTVHIWKRVK